MVYVMTTKNATKPTEKELDKVHFNDPTVIQKQIKTLSLTPSQKVEFNIKDGKDLNISFAKNDNAPIPDGVEVTIKSESGCPLRIDEKATIVGGNIRLTPQFDYEVLKNQFPQEVTSCRLLLSIVNRDDILRKDNTCVVLTPSEVTLVIKNKKERVLKVELID
jgi:hypothetical protein